MPRDGSGVYTKPYPSVVSGTTIESLVYNGQVDDVAQDLNTPRPISAGGTGANNAAGGLFNLGGEKATQVVTNYDSHVWVPGSFRSAAAATGAPNATAIFSGTCYIHEALANPPTNQNVTVEARDATDNKLYIRRKTAGSWGAWAVDGGSLADLDARYVNITGDTMSGTLTAPVLVATGAVWSQVSATTGNYVFGTGGTKTLSYDGTNFVFTGGAVSSAAGVKLGGNNNIVRDGPGNTLHTSDVGHYFQNAAGSVNYLSATSTGVETPSDMTATKFVCRGHPTAYFTSGAAYTILQWDGTYYFQHELALGSLNFVLNNTAWTTWNFAGGLIHNSTNAQKTGGGSWIAISDARIKTVKADYTQGLDAILQLRPVTYTYKGNEVQGPVLDESAITKDTTPLGEPNKRSSSYTAAVSGQEFIGLVAQEVEIPMPEMVKLGEGWIDGEKVTDLRALDTGPLIFALINAVKTLTARIEALEAK